MVEFNPSTLPTIGVELELQIIDAETLLPRNIAEEVLKEVHPRYQDRIKREFLQSMIELNTKICSSVAEAEKDLRSTLQHLEEILGIHGARFLSCSLHPCAETKDQQVADHPRYARIMNDLQWVGRRFICQGLHVHIGIDDPEKAIRVNNTIRIFLPLLLALSTSSPFFEGETTGLLSFRTKLFEALPLAGMPDYLDGWTEFNHVADLLIKGGYIESVKDLWWDVRPHPDFGTVEVRICDIPLTLADTLAITALIQALVVTIAEETAHPDPHIQILRANKWQGARYGLEGVFVDPVTAEKCAITDAIVRLYEYVRPAASMLGGVPYLDGVHDILDRKTGAHRMLRVHRNGGGFPAVLNDMLEGYYR